MSGDERSVLRTVGGLGAIAVVLTVWQHVAWARDVRALPERVVIATLTPGQVLVSRALTGVSDLALSLAAAATLRKENRELREEVARLQADRLRLMEYFIENKKLRRELRTPLPPTFDRIAVAQVVGRSPGILRRRVTIKAADGVELAKDDLLLSGGCLAGRVIEAHGSIGRAVLIVDHEHALAALDQRSRDQGMLYAEPVVSGPDMLRMDKLVGRCDLKVGDVIITSGLGQLYPRGLPVGRIESVQKPSGAGRAVRALVKPFVDFEHLEFVTVARVTTP